MFKISQKNVVVMEIQVELERQVKSLWIDLDSLIAL